MPPSIREDADQLPPSVAVSKHVLLLEGVEPSRENALTLLTCQEVTYDQREALRFILDREVDIRTLQEFPQLATLFHETMHIYRLFHQECRRQFEMKEGPVYERIVANQGGLASA